jgi:hypothetical protein
MDYRGDEFDEAVVSWAHDIFSSTACTWTLFRALDTLREGLSLQRDGATALDRKRAKPADVDHMRRQVLRSGLDARLLADDIIAYATNARSFRWNQVGWDERCESKGPEPERQALIEQWRQSLIWSAGQLGELESVVGTLLATDSNLRAAASNLHLQRSVRRLTLVILVLTLVAVVVAVIALLKADSGQPKEEASTVVMVTMVAAFEGLLDRRP